VTAPDSARAAILGVGDELVLGTTLDTNSQRVAVALRDAGYATVEHRTVGDDLEAIVRALRELAERHDLVVVTGGLGPTDDDLTREALNEVADAGAPMLEDAERRHDLRAWFEGRGRPMPPMNARQALRPRSARTLPNPHGTAPGLAARVGGARVFCLPGPPAEMLPMLEAHVLPDVARDGRPPVVRRAVQTFGLGEASVAERLGARMRRGREPAVGTTASQSIVTVQIVAQGDARAAERADAEAGECAAVLAPYAFGGAQDTLAGALVAAARAGGTRLAVAESCTAGLVGAAIGSVPGASAVFQGGWIAYANALKVREVGVRPETLAADGAVSAACAAELAEGAARRGGAELGIAVTGIAGPEGGTPEKPVGTVFIAVHRVEPRETRVRAFHFPGPRDVVRDRAAKAALQMARWCALDVDAPMLWERPLHGAAAHGPGAATGAGESV
jgi:nicotinamide-nucleotide amidase